jgi:hypothetical protein
MISLLTVWWWCVWTLQLFTNSDRAHMKKALERLGVDEACFDDVVCIETMNPHLYGEVDDAGAQARRWACSK